MFEFLSKRRPSRSLLPQLSTLAVAAIVATIAQTIFVSPLSAQGAKAPLHWGSLFQPFGR